MQEPEKERPKDPGNININNDKELNWWSAQLGVEKQKILQAVKIVGSSVITVKRYFKHKKII